MTIALLASLALLAATLTVAALTIRDAHARTDRLIDTLINERANHDQTIRTLLAAHATERSQAHPDLTELIGLTERLAQRIQAPAEAIVEHQMAQPLPPSPAAIPFDDDKAFWDAQEEPISKEALAELVDAHV